MSGLFTALPAAAAPASAKTVYFTFDDGPGAGTAELLDAAAAYDAKVTLFYVGRNGEARPELVARAAAEGHVIGNHTYSHKSLPAMSIREMHQQLTKAQEALRPHVSNCWRPPGWATSAVVEQTAKELGLRQTLSVMDPADSRRVFVPAAWTDPDMIVSAVQEQVFDGAMVTLHAEGAHAWPQLQAFKQLLPLLTAEGYTFKALPYCTMPTHKLLAVGDSVTSGTGTANYRSRLDSLLRRGAEPRGLNHRWVGSVANSPAIGLNHDGHQGWTVQQMDRSIGVLQARYRPDVILVNAGTADIVRGANAATVARRVAGLLRHIRQNQPEAKVFVSIPPALAGGRNPAAQRQNAALQREMPGVIRAAGPGFHPVDLSGAGAADSAKIAIRYYQAIRGTLPGSGRWPSVPKPSHR
ncbi:polysaccharide deacetylase family protein [Actinoplanes aureus]|uniref:Polysaccharide deacetylase family protein n=1 Tax=Actinoplanes aureus TaxID=2792083 RepID=A0A931G0G4_9ACTN|nr:polysaccharide deacetylase family protein [Actinoplanes aureus]MBG0565845.1 polysaccharide deacetylase family protein [Actinoplanes aureus]